MLPDTQLTAFWSIRDQLSERQDAVFCSICKFNGSTLFEVSEKLEKPLNQLSGRITELRKLKAIHDTGKRRINPLTNRNAIVWKRGPNKNPSKHGKVLTLKDKYSFIRLVNRCLSKYYIDQNARAPKN